jgi:hypothetical protein
LVTVDPEMTRMRKVFEKIGQAAMDKRGEKGGGAVVLPFSSPIRTTAFRAKLCENKILA